MKHIINYSAATLFVALFFGVIYLADQDMQAAAKMDKFDIAAINAENRLQRAAKALCVSEAGPGAQVLWTADGDLVCRPDVMTSEK